MTLIEQKVFETMTSPPLADRYSVGSIIGRMSIGVSPVQIIKAIESLIIQGKVRLVFQGQVYFAPVIEEIANAS
jgi:hypothetical protein